MEPSELDKQIQRLAINGVIEIDNNSSRDGIPSFLWKVSQFDHLGYTHEERDRLCLLATKVHQLAEQWQTNYPPLFAVTGLKNAGKSSLVKSFLSDDGRKRTPTGNEEDYATRRYVFWLPKSWQKVGEASPFEEMLKHVFRNEVEEPSAGPKNEVEKLSANPETASRQYREDSKGQGMTRPLVAYDHKLDDWNIGIVDCPDIETGGGSDKSKLNLIEARKMLEKASRLCAAFVVIGKYDGLGRDPFWQILRTVREVGPKSDEFLVINKCPPKPVNRLHDELMELSRKEERVPLDGIKLFAGYNFAHKGSEKFMVQVSDGELPAGCATGDDNYEELKFLLPTFFSCNGDSPHPPQPIPKASLLQSAVQALPSAQLKQQFQLKMASDLQSYLQEAKEEITSASQKTSKLVTNAYKDVAGVFFQAMTKDGVVTPLQNRKLAERQIQLLIDEAPPMISFSMRATNWMRKLLTGSVDYVKDKVFGKPGKVIREGKERLRKEGTKLNAADIARDLCRSNSFGSVVGQKRNSDVTKWVKAAFEKFSDEFDRDLETLRPLVRQYYEQMNWKDYAWAHAWAIGTLAVLLVAAVMVTVDGGATLYGISLLEGLLVAGGAATADLVQTRTTIQEAEKPLVEGQLAFLTSEVTLFAGLPPMSKLDHTIELKKKETSYRLKALAQSSRQQSVKISRLDVDHGFLDGLMLGLRDFQNSGEVSR